MAKRNLRYIQYNASSLAPKLEPKKPVSRPKSQPKPEITYTLAVDPLPFIAIVMAAVMLVLMVVGCVELAQVRDQEEKLYHYVQDLREETVTLKDKFDKRVDMELLEAAAIGLGMIPIEQAQRITVSADPYEPAQFSLWQQLKSAVEGLFA